MLNFPSDTVLSMYNANGYYELCMYIDTVQNEIY
jgi:hypothetical protein